MPSKKYYKRKGSRKSHQNKRHRRHRKTKQFRRLKRNKTRRRAGMLGRLTGRSKSSWNPPAKNTTQSVLGAKKPTNQLTRKQVEKDLQRMREQRSKENKSEAIEARAQEAVDRYRFNLNLNLIKQARLAKEKLTEQKIKEIEHFIKTAPDKIHNINKLKQEFEALKQEILADNLSEEFDKTPSPDKIPSPDLKFLEDEFDS